MFITEDVARAIKDVAQVQEVIGKFVTLKKAGADLKGECPFCHEKKFSVSKVKQIYKCWHCEKSGNNSVSFLMEKEKFDYPSALKWLAVFYNIRIPEEQSSPPPKARKKKDELQPKAEDPPIIKPDEPPLPGVKKKSEFLKSTMRSIGLRPDKNKVQVKWLNRASQSETIPLIAEDVQGNLEFMVYDINGFVVTHQRQTKDGLEDIPYKVIRLKEPVLNKDGKMMKYKIPAGVGTRPFFPPSLLDKFLQSTPIETLFLTEGYKKAISGWVNGLDIVGLTSISTYRDKETMQLHRDIVDLILKCNVKNVVILYDGDCANISAKAFEEEKDISTRPQQFFSSANGIKELLKDYLKDYEISLYFAHVISESVEGAPKGLDDIYEAMTKVQYKALLQLVSVEPNFIHRGRLLIEAKKVSRQILNPDLQAFSREGAYFKKINISIGVRKLEQHLALDSSTSFYLRHQEIIKDRRFIYFGTKLKYNLEKGECEVIIPAESQNYYRIGDDYHEIVLVPNKYGDLEEQLHRRDKTTIIDDYGKKFLLHIQKMKTFINKADHINYQPIINSCYNMYSRFEWEPEEGDCTMTLDFLKHIFEEQLELGLDYLQLLYTRPLQMLPILCLVSKENNTGKTTFSKWLRHIYRRNMAVVGNADLASDFNGYWITKLIICCDEAFIEKKLILEKIKSLSTADQVVMNQKGIDQREMGFFGKFIMLSNNEDNFVNATEDDIRYWIRKIKRPVKEIVNLDRVLIQEISAFLYYLSKRTMSTQFESRMWFHPDLLVTEALLRVRLASQSTLEKDLRVKIQTMFEDFSENIITMSISDIRKEFFNNGKYEEKYIRDTLRDKLKVDQWWEPDPADPSRNIYKSKRYTYPKWHLENRERVDVKCNGRPFVFLRPDYITPEHEYRIQQDPEQLALAEPVPPHYQRPGMLVIDKKITSLSGYRPVQSDMPFPN